MKTILLLAGFTLGVLSAVAQPQIGIDKLVPTHEQLGADSLSNRIVVLVDPLSSPSVVTNAAEGPGWLKGAQNIVGKEGREAYGVLRCFCGPNSVLVGINRFKSQEVISPDWGTDREAGTQTTLDKLPNVGEEVRFYRRGGMHNNIAFRRGTFLIDVEGTGAPIEKLKQIAEVMDGNLLKALGRSAESSTAAGTGVVSVAPQKSELGATWDERNVIFAIDPREQPAEYVNTVPVKDPTKRASSILRDVRKALSMNGSVGMTEIWYGHSGNILELVISRYPDQQALDKRWKELSAKFDAKAVAPKVGQTAAWLDNGAEAPGRMFVFRQGLFTGWVTCKVAVSGEPLMQLVKVTADKMAKAAELAASPNAAVPHR